MYINMVEKGNQLVNFSQNGITLATLIYIYEEKKKVSRIQLISIEKNIEGSKMRISTLSQKTHVNPKTNKKKKK